MSNQETNRIATHFQIFSRNNDKNGIPYRLLLVYDAKGNTIEAYESRASLPNQAQQLRQRNLGELPSFHISPSEYRDTVVAYKAFLQSESY